MSLTRRTFLVGAVSGLSVLVLAACTDTTPQPTPSPEPTNDTDAVPAPRSFYRSNWASDPFARGATSFTAVGQLTQSRVTLQEAVLGRVFFAGEALSDEPGTVRGATSSGRAAARRALDAMAAGERVAVIGAGAAGAAAARSLKAGGADVIVLEARDRTGGRVDSRVVDDDSFELGAWRLSDLDDDAIVNALAREGVAVSELNGDTAYALEDDDSLALVAADDPALTAVAGALAEATAWALDQTADVSVEEALTQGSDPASWPTAAATGVTGELLADELLMAVAGTSGADADALSAWFSTLGPSGVQVVPLGPLSSFIDSTLDGIETALSTAVIGVFYDDSGVSLRLATGESLAVDRVVVTVPLGVLQEQVIEFDPVLPLSHRAALNDVSVGHIELIRMEYETAFWDTEAVWWVREGDDEPIRMWINLLPATGRPVLMGIVAGQRALELGQAGDDELEDLARRSLAPFARPSS